jgi:hypothetical protein
MSVTVNLSGEGIEFEREVSESTALSIMELSMNNDATEDGKSTDVEPDALPGNFFNRLSSKQRALIRVLLDEDDRITSTELRRRMRDEHGIETDGGRALAGILAGFTRKYGDDFDLVKMDWGDGEGLYQLNPEHPEYIGEIEEHFDD